MYGIFTYIWLIFMVNVDNQVHIPYMDPMGHDCAFNDFSDHYPEKLKKHDPNLTGADVFDIGWVEEKHQLLGSEIPLTEVSKFSPSFFREEKNIPTGSMGLVDLLTFAIKIK